LIGAFSLINSFLFRKKPMIFRKFHFC